MGGGGGEVQTYLAPVSVKLIINLLEHRYFFPPQQPKAFVVGGYTKKSNIEDVAVAQLCKYCDYYVNVYSLR